MQHSRARLEQDAITSPVQTEGKVHVLEIGAERLGKDTGSQERVAAIEGAGSAGPENVSRPQMFGPQQLAVAMLAGDATEIVAIARAIDGRLFGRFSRPAQHERR